MIDVIIEDIEKMNLLGLMIGKLLKDTINDKVSDEYTVKNKGEYEITGSKMSIILSFTTGKLTIKSKPSSKIKAGIIAPLSVLLDIALGKGYIKSFLKGKLKIKGNPIKLLPLLKLF